MGRSQETFNKKEKEKKKLKKRQDKEEKKAERKANSVKGKSDEDMIAYVDEFGRISSTPPDPTKKRIAVKLEDIQISVARQSAEDQADVVHEGIITFFNDAKGYGFIRDLNTQQSIFVHINDINGTVKENEKVTFEIGQGQKGPTAVSVKKIV